VPLLRARDAFRRGGEVGAPLAALEGLLDECYVFSPRYPMCALVDARRALLRVDREGARGGVPRSQTLAWARERAAFAVDANPPDADAHEALAQAERRLALWATSQDERDEHRAAGLAACAAGLAVNPRQRDLLAAQAELEGLR